MTICFIGSGNFAIPILEFLSKNYEIALVVTRPDAKKGRGQKLVNSDIHELAQSLGIYALTPESVNDHDAIQMTREKNIDLGILASYSEILSLEAIKAFKLGILNIHPSLLPKYRGAEPIRWPIRKDEKTTGVTMMMLTEKLDRGNIISQKELPIEDSDDFGSLSEKLADLSIKMLPDAINLVSSGFEGAPQSQEKTFYARRMKPEDERIDWQKTAMEISLHVRSMSPTPGCHSVYKDKRIKLFEPRIEMAQGEPGQVMLAKKSFSVACADCSVSFGEIQKEGGKKMSVQDFMSSGFLNANDKFN